MLPWLHPLTDLQLPGLGLRDEDLRGVALDALRGLTRMNMAKNQLETFPSAVLRLHRLTELDFSHNKMAAVPQGIGKLRRLRRLNLMCNKLSGAVPESLGRLTQLEVLGLRTNSLTALPTTIGCCVSLVELYVTENNLKALPASLGQCKRLRKLQASFNDLTTLPVEMAGCESLELCRLAANPSLSEVPSEITCLPSLAWLSLAGSLWSPGLGMWGEGSLENLKRTDLRFGKKVRGGCARRSMNIHTVRTAYELCVNCM
ncbi:hypothetical protein JKP88DRAFT_169218 [Tribonema minus]|uniref:Uncharacterized protein n=1 Tax=Tribonema minus TaxID=303371 RepID=A0A836CAE2_9STRA|nr:hypothetical protein JKP88DRAFT_169218 [Tribonema minus]